MRQVIKSDAESGDGVSIEREQPFTAFKTMPHITTWDGLIARQAGFQKADEFIKLGDIKGEYEADELPGGFDPLNETTNFDPKILGPISGEGVFKPQDIDTKGSVIVGDNHFTPDRGGDSLTGEGRPTKIWTNGGASTFEDRTVGDYDANDAVFGVGENIDWTAANGGNGSSWLTAKNASKVNAYVDEDVDGFMKLGDIGAFQADELRSDNSFVMESFEPLAGMNSFGESLNPVAELGGTAGPGASTFMTEKIGANPGQMLSPLSGGDGCPF
ncbi:hypothetical protein [Synechococcus sp. MIT S9508]|uniref:hypothetical protein n=1 Tax=Synechococcus sp. MIT S9508 TaxID=1801629 RepID=UPI0007BB93F6|nr:hypothetical protein [Synechococcus sp. MIT S9508]KZR87492.1 hypothetical protein MITS9508_02445 [Synechococcus sp. MIT S9508]